MPVIAFNALYRWASGEGQTSASYRIGIDTGAYQSGVLTAVRIEGDQRRMIMVDERDL